MASVTQTMAEIKSGINVEFKDRYGKTCRSPIREVCRVRRIGQLTSVLVIDSKGGYAWVKPDNFKLIPPGKK